MSHYQQQQQYGQAPHMQQYSQQSYQGQPQATPSMSVTAPGGNRNSKNKPMGSDGRDWSEGICGCCGDCGTWCLACFCPCMVYAQNKTRYEHLNNRGTPHPSGGEMCTGSCWGHGALTAFCGLGWVLQIGTRGSIRHRYNIAGGGCGDCCAVFWCNPCALTQESQELELEEQSMQQRR